MQHVALWTWLGTDGFCWELMLFLRCILSILGRPEKNCPKQNNIYKSTQQITEQIAAPTPKPMKLCKAIPVRSLSDCCHRFLCASVSNTTGHLWPQNWTGWGGFYIVKKRTSHLMSQELPFVMSTTLAIGNHWGTPKYIYIYNTQFIIYIIHIYNTVNNRHNIVYTI